MPVTTLDLKTALVVVDLQKGILAYAKADAVASVLKAASALTAAFRKRDLPVVLVNVSASAPGRSEQRRSAINPSRDSTEFLLELGQQPSDIVVTKKTWGAFASTDLEAQLRRLGVTQVVVCGIATTAGVESTARQAFEAGFNVTLALDAMTDMNPDAHANSVTRIFPRLGETGTSAEIIGLLGKNGGAP